MSDLGAFGAIAGGVMSLIAGVLLMAFFATGRDVIGRANDVASAAMAVLLIPAAIAVNEVFAGTGPYVVIVTVVGVIGMIAATVASILTAAGRLTVEQLTVWQGGSFGVIFLWVLGVSVAILAFGILPTALGWLGILAGALVAVAIASIGLLSRRPGGLAGVDWNHPPMVPLVAFLAGFLCFPIWSIGLGLNL